MPKSAAAATVSSSSSHPAPSSSSSSPTVTASSSGSSSKKRYRKDKPWDTDDIDHWAPVPVTPETPLPPPVDESSFAVLFPRYREQYLRQVWPLLTRSLAHYGIACQLDLIEGSMTVRTTRRCWDVSMILKARDVLKLLSRSLPVHQAVRVLQDEVYCDVIKIKNLVRNKERFVKRRQRLIGPNGCTLKAIELVTDCYVLVQGNTVSCIGQLKPVKQVRRVVEDCMRNVHPIYHIKQLMIRQQLQADPQLKDQSWDRFLPQFKKRTVDRRKPRTVRQRGRGEDGEDRAASVFPPPPTPRKVDLLMESGEFFLSKEEKEEKAEGGKRRRREEVKEKKRKEREKDFMPPAEGSRQKQQDEETKDSGQRAAEGEKRKKRRREEQKTEEAGEGEDRGEGGGRAGSSAAAAPVVELAALKAKLTKGRVKGGAQSAADVSSFLIGGAAELSTESAVDGDGTKKRRKQGGSSRSQ